MELKISLVCIKLDFATSFNDFCEAKVSVHDSFCFGTKTFQRLLFFCGYLFLRLDLNEECFYIDSINQLIASQLEKRSNIGTETVFYPPTPNRSMTFDDDEQSNLTPIIGNPQQHPSRIPQRRNHPIQLCRHLQPIPDTPESPPLDYQCQSDIFRPYDLPNPPTSASYNNHHKVLNSGLRVAKYDNAPPSGTQ